MDQLFDSQNDNDLTLRTYEAKAQEYVDGTPYAVNEVEGSWMDYALSLIPKDGRILELGSGAGRNAAYIQQQGYTIECTDAVASFVQLIKSKGMDARLLNALKDELGSDYSMVFANGVLVHFTAEETAMLLDKIHFALKDNGIFAFSIKQGDGSQWTEEKLDAPRYFYYWQQEPLQRLLQNHGFEWLGVMGGHTSARNAKWVYAVTRKLGKLDKAQPAASKV